MLEDVVAPAKATLMSHGTIKEGYAEEGSIALPGILRPGANGIQIFLKNFPPTHFNLSLNFGAGELPYGAGSLQRAQYGAVGGQVTTTHVPPVRFYERSRSLQDFSYGFFKGQQPKIFDTSTGKAQRALLGTIEASIKTIERAEEDLRSRAELPPLGDDLSSKKWKETQMDVQKQHVSDHLAAMGAATAQVVQLTGCIAVSNSVSLLFVCKPPRVFQLYPIRWTTPR